ncbi:hypothetical protein DYBT9275_05614 [Dyadobacter sp. CECT 9275]|uniref:Uncharacterized protein n=1 Tax=Dyadobacter helix TaxID=2822344 RepID=A0A916NEH9_9BACT|nr:hypothetical protein DYBT9275_05614 [Dyadobacter sp. CECT 9275]
MDERPQARVIKLLWLRAALNPLGIGSKFVQAGRGAIGKKCNPPMKFRLVYLDTVNVVNLIPLVWGQLMAKEVPLLVMVPL